MNLRQACRPCRGSCSLIPGRDCFGDLPGDEIVASPPSPIVEPLAYTYNFHGIVAAWVYDSIIHSGLNRWGKDVHCIVGVLGNATTRYDSVITRKGEGASVEGCSSYKVTPADDKQIKYFHPYNSTVKPLPAEIVPTRKPKQKATRTTLPEQVTKETGNTCSPYNA